LICCARKSKTLDRQRGRAKERAARAGSSSRLLAGLPDYAVALNTRRAHGNPPSLLTYLKIDRLYKSNLKIDKRGRSRAIRSFGARWHTPQTSALNELVFSPILGEFWPFFPYGLFANGGDVL
jgi:hypothetical protein